MPAMHAVEYSYGHSRRFLDAIYWSLFVVYFHLLHNVTLGFISMNTPTVYCEGWSLSK